MNRIGINKMITEAGKKHLAVQALNHHHWQNPGDFSVQEPEHDLDICTYIGVPRQSLNLKDLTPLYDRWVANYEAGYAPKHP